MYVNGFDAKFSLYADDTVIYCGGFTLAETFANLLKTFKFILNVTRLKLIKFLNEEATRSFSKRKRLETSSETRNFWTRRSTREKLLTNSYYLLIK